MSAPDDGTLRAILDGMRHGSVHITADRCSGDSRAVAAFCDLVRVAPALAAEVLRLREAIETQARAVQSLDNARDAHDARDQRVLASLEARDRADLLVALDAARAERDAWNAEATELRERAERAEAAARAHLAADDALSLARRTDAADVPTAEARALAARECLAGLVGYTGEAGR